MELTLDRISKQFQNHIAVDGFSYAMSNGVYGLLGANGAGKTTLMRMICTVLNPTSGEILFNGTSISDMGQNIVTFLAICRRTSVTTRISPHMNFFCIWHR